MKKGYMYILECADGSYYTGSTTNLELRLWQHQNGEGANYTRKRLPVKLVYFEEFNRIDKAYYREKQVKGWSKKKKEALIKGRLDELKKLAECKNGSHCKRAPFDSAQGAPFDCAQKAPSDCVQGAPFDRAQGKLSDGDQGASFDFAQEAHYETEKGDFDYAQSSFGDEFSSPTLSSTSLTERSRDLLGERSQTEHSRSEHSSQTTERSQVAERSRSNLINNNNKKKKSL